MSALGLVLVLALAACDGPPPVDAAPQVSVRVPLSAPRLARRLSLDLRGVLPDVAELDAVEADPGALDGLIDAWLDDPRLEDRLVDLLAEQWHTRVDEYDIRYYDYGLAPDQEHAFERAVGEEPLRLMAHVATQDVPWSDIVQADWTRADPLLASLWPLDCDPGEGWQTCRWSDGRPAAGVLSSNGLWWRYSTSSFNLSRARAAAISRLLICEDIAGRPVSFSATPSLLDEDGTAAAVASEPACVGCHASLDPLAAALFGFFPVERYSVAEMTRYHPEREPSGPGSLGVGMAWFGQPVAGLAHLGAAIAADPRFASCAVETFAAGLWRRPVGLGDRDALDALRVDFQGSGLQVRPLIRALLAGERYQVGALTADADAETLESERTERLLPPEVVGQALTALTGFRWTYEAFDVLRSDETGYRVLAGGVSGTSVVQPQREPGLTWLALHQRLAEAAAGHVVHAELVTGDADTALLDGADLDLDTDEAAFGAVVERLHWQLLAVRPTDLELAESAALWDRVAEISGPEIAWQALVGLLFLDPRFLAS